MNGIVRPTPVVLANLLSLNQQKGEAMKVH